MPPSTADRTSPLVLGTRTMPRGLVCSLPLLLMGICLLADVTTVRASDADNRTTATTLGLDLLEVVQKTMALQPTIQLQREQVNLAQGAQRSSSGNFDGRVQPYFVMKQDYAPIISMDPILQSGLTSQTGFIFSKLFRSGVSFEPSFKYTESSYRLLTEQRLPPTKTGSVALLFRVPLLQGRGLENTAVGEIAATHELQAERLTLSHEIARSIYQAVQAYWAYLAAHQQLAVLRQAEERANTIKGKTFSMVQADELPAAELINVRANLADKERTRVAAEQTVFAAKAELGMTMGIPTTDIVALPAPIDDFPKPEQGLQQQALTANNIAYAKIAIASRQDLRALGERNNATKARLQAAANRVKPKLDLELSLGYDGATAGSSLQRALQTVEMRQEGPDWSTGLTLNYPLGNNTGLGDLAQLLASYRQGALRELELIRTIQKEIAVVCSNLVNIDRELERTDEALTNYTTAVANEQEKYLMGETTLLDLLYIEDRRDNALLSRISILQRAAGSLARLRFETGKLVSFASDAGRVTDHDLTTLLAPE